MRAFLQHLLDRGEDTSDALRALVPIPAGTDARVVGAAVRTLAESDLIVSVGRRKTLRDIAHARKLDVWAVRDEAKARHRLATNPDLDPPADTAEMVGPGEPPADRPLTFSAARWAEYLARKRIPWPRLPSGKLAPDDETFREMAIGVRLVHVVRAVCVRRPWRDTGEGTPKPQKNKALTGRTG